MLTTYVVTMVEVSDWDQFVIDTYGRPYAFQQQDGCKSRGTFTLKVPDDDDDDYVDDTVPEVVNGDDMGVSFKAWLERDPKKLLKGDRSKYSLELWWERNFYPDVQTIANDLHDKGILQAGSYTINIDW